MFKINKKAECLRNVFNFSKQNKYHKFDKDLDVNKFKKDMPITSPKLIELLKNIKILDDNDFLKEGKYYKHIIYTDLKSSATGAKMIASGFITEGYKSIYDNTLKIKEDLFKTNKNKNFALLTSVQVYSKPFSVKLKKNILEKFNERPDNIYGENIRFIILDQGYKEGIDVFDVKYTHIFDNLISISDEKQVIGRGTRYCGQKGLKFDTTLGWVLHVFKYYLLIDKKLEVVYKNINTFGLFMDESGINLNKLIFAGELEEVSKYGAVDYDLTKKIHNFNKNIESSIIFSKSNELLELKKYNENSSLIYSHIDMSKKVIYENIDDRIRYNSFINEKLKSIAKNQCIEYIGINDKDKIYKINENIVLKKQIGTDSAYGLVFLTMDKTDKNILIATKLLEVSKDHSLEIELLNKLSKVVLSNKNIHFPIIYNTFTCNVKNINNDNYPDLINNKEYYMILNELANGDLNSFLKEFNNNYEYINNALQQIYIAILSFHLTTNYIHSDTHWGNFLYHKINPGGYIHYKIYNKDIYVKNLGFIWVIWDFGLVSKVREDNKRLLISDYTTINYQFNSIISNDTTNPFLINYNKLNNISNINDENKLWEYILNNDIYIQKLSSQDNNIINKEPIILNNSIDIKIGGGKHQQLYKKGINIKNKNLFKSNDYEDIVIHNKKSEEKTNLPVIPNINDPIIKKTDEIILPINDSIKETPVISPLKVKLNNIEMRKYIMKNYNKFIWDDIVMENKCIEIENNNDNKKDNRLVTFTKTQDFIANYFNTYTPYKGLLLWHSTGVGKTCSAINIASKCFELKDYTILWVTKFTLKTDIWKNMFNNICSVVLRKKIMKGENIPNLKNVKAPMKYLSDRWITPISYKQFTNLLAGKNKFYNEMVKRNGVKDPLKKTLIIIDEVHKLYSDDLPLIERPNLDILNQKIKNSYKISKENSVKLLLMSATPFTNDPMVLIKIINLLKEENELIEEDFDVFKSKYLDDKFKFTPEGKKSYLDKITGYISYLNREKDNRYFSYPMFHEISTTMSTIEQKSPELKKLLTKKEDITKKIKDNNNKDEIKLLKKELKDINELLKKEENTDLLSQEEAINQCLGKSKKKSKSNSKK